ncbi:STAS domain-containing protein [Mycobacterium sp. 236(2023)]|uniref:STAS domain-containing protein n=1 Tax=Mycobacterium sp. 236(2023) TaxID=3038163 RepID=UPI0024152486|nr:STAS domain-containing protein [Mycobacterium sp. 236(2023)]MDG4669309.1 STAS domain-containing protein [Mycobacterium sp. 236(2023)]
MADEIDKSAFPPARSEVTVHKDLVDGVVVLALFDVVDAATAPEVSSAVDEALANSPSALVIDLTGVTFLASVGMSILIKAKEDAGKDIGFAVVAEGNATRRPLTLVGLDSEMTLCLTRDEALRAVAR